MEPNNEEIRIRGILVPVGWDQNGNVTRVALMAAHEEEYLVEEVRSPEKLFGFVRHEVEVRGLVREEAGLKIITVEDYKQIE